MAISFEEIVRQHAARYPDMTAQDFCKLAYQSEYGPEHAIESPEAAAAALLAEWRAVGPELCPAPLEPIGNGLCRFALTGAYSPDAAAPLLARLFARTAAEHRGTAQGMEQRLQTVCAASGLPGVEAAVEAYRRSGCPAVHHSEAFRAAYHPHYRLLEGRYACFFPALLAVEACAASGKPALIGIDGRCASGKTTLAALLQSLFACNVYHMDDFYLPPAQRADDWQSCPGGNMDFARFRHEVLEPTQAGEAVQHRAYACREGRLLPPRNIPPRPLTVVEGSYSAHPALGAPYTLRIFLTCPPEQQASRLQAREGSYYKMFQERWIPLEEHYFEKYAIAQGSALLLDTGGLSNF